MATANLGRVGFVNKGTYNGATAYKVNDVVVYNGGTYACIQSNTGQAVTNTSYWQNWVADNAVHKNGDETIAGVKTFSNSVVISDNVGVGGTPASGFKQEIFGPSIASPATTSSRLSLRELGNVSALNFVSANEGSALVERIWSSTALSLGSNATERVRIDTSGNVGIGTTNTGLNSEQLHIANSTAPKFMLTNTIGYSWSILVPTNNGELKFKYEQGSITPLTIDRNGNVLFNNGTFGYSTGSGGTVTQLTSKSTAVTLNKPCGQIIMNNAALAAGGTAEFTFNNSLITNKDQLLLISSTDAISANFYSYTVRYIGNGSSLIRVTNTSGATLSDTPIVNFTVIKGATA